jgi:CRISP-associated protein Cas1
MPIVPHLIADQFGSHVGKYSERLRITKSRQTLTQAPLLHLESVHILNKGVSISADALEACCERGIPIYFVDSHGEAYASIYSSGLMGTVLTRREQMRAFDDERGGYVACQMATGKIVNQSVTLKYLAKSRKNTPEGEALRLAALDLVDRVALIDKLRTRGTIDRLRDHLFAVEGNAARVYWDALKPIIPPDYAWPGREGRGAQDAINSLLNYGYGILYGQIERALVLAGLDPFGGFIHADRPGKASLTLDLIEEFRQPVVDRVVIGLVTRSFRVEQDEKARLSEGTRHAFADHILTHLDATMRFEGERRPLGQIIQIQARRLAAYLRKDQVTYEPFKSEW